MLRTTEKILFILSHWSRDGARPHGLDYTVAGIGMIICRFALSAVFRDVAYLLLSPRCDPHGCTPSWQIAMETLKQWPLAY